MAEALEAAQEQAKKDEEAALENLRGELDNKTKDECEKIRLESKLLLIVQSLSSSFFFFLSFFFGGGGYSLSFLLSNK